MNRTLLASLLLAASTLCSCTGEARPPAPSKATEQAEAPKPAPKAWFEADREVHDFGDVYAAAIRETTFDLVAAGTEDLVIKDLKRSCGCTEGELFLLDENEVETPVQFGHPYPTGTRFRLHASLNSRGRYGEQDQKVLIELEGHEFPTTYSLKAEIVNFIVLDPPALKIPNASTLEGFTGELLVKSKAGERFKVSVRNDILPPELTVDLDPVEPDQDGRSDRWIMSFTAAPGVKKGLYKQKLILRTDAENSEAAPRADGTPAYHMGEVWIRTEVKGIFDIRPERLSFGRMPADRKTSRKVIVRSRDPEFRMEEIEILLFNREGSDLFEYRDDFEVIANPIDDGRAWDIEIQAHDLNFEGPFTGILGIRCGHELEAEAAVPFTGEVRAPTN